MLFCETHDNGRESFVKSVSLIQRSATAVLHGSATMY